MEVMQSGPPVDAETVSLNAVLAVPSTRLVG